MAVEHKRKRQQQDGAKAAPTQQTKNPNAGKKGGKRKRAESNKETKKTTVAKVVASGITSRPVLLRRSADLASSNGKKKVLPAALDQYFCELVELVPANLYNAPDEAAKEAQWLARSKFQHNTKGNAPKQAIKEASQKSKKKRAKFDTDEFKSVKQVRHKKEMEEEMEGEEEDEDDEDVDMNEDNKRTSPPRQPASNLQELRERMNKRLSELQAQRTAKPKPGQGTSKQDRKVRRAAEREAAGIVVVPGVGVKSPAKAESKKNKKEKKTTVTEVVEETTTQDDDTATKIHDALASSLGGNISYGNLDLGGDGKQLFDGQQVRKVKKPRTNKLLDVQRLLTKAEKNQERVQLAAAESGGAATTNLETNDAAFKAMEQKTLGVTVRDNPKLLRKTLKKMEQKKKKSSKTWAARDAEVKKSKGDKIKKRDGNISQRSEKIIEKKLKRKGISIKSDKPEEKRPRQRPGFEGKRKGNLNDYEGGAGAGGKDGKESKAKAPKKGSKAFK